MKKIFFSYSLPFSMTYQRLAIWSLVPLPFLNLVCTSGSSQLMYSWSLAWKILNITLLACEMSPIAIWKFFCIAILWDWTDSWPFEVLCPLLCFPNLVIYWVQHFNNTIFRIWNNLARIPSPPLASFLVMLPKTHLTSHSRMSRSRWMSRSFWFFGHYNLFLCNSSVYSPLLNLFCFC